MIQMLLRFFIFFAFLVFGLLFTAVQNLFSEDTGFKLFKNYDYIKDYGHNPQNWAIIQDSRGILYVGNLGGVLEFDGVYWRRIFLPNWWARSLSIDETGTIYIGGKNEIGFLEPGSKRKIQYVSLLNHLNENERNFSNVLFTHSTEKGVYFTTYKFLFRWNPGHKHMKVWKSEDRLLSSFACQGKFFICRENTGLMQMEHDSLKLAAGGEAFAALNISLMVPYDYAAKKLLIGTRSTGLFLYDGTKAVPFHTNADDYLRKNKIYRGVRLSSGDFALATLRGGLVIMDSHGHLKQIFNKSSGLQDDNVKYVFEDSGGNLWLALNNGISKIEYTSPFSIYDDRANLPGMVMSITRHRKDLYVGTTSGLFILSAAGKIQPVPGITTVCWSLLSDDDFVLAAADHGVFQVETPGNRMIIEGCSFFLMRSRRVRHRIWVGTKQGLVSLCRQNRMWELESQFKNITLPIRTIVEDKKGNLWLGTLTKGVIKVDFAGGFAHPVVNRYYTSHGLPRGRVNIYPAAGHVMFATDKGLFRFNEAKQAFVRDSTLGKKFAEGTKSVFRIVEAQNKHIWFHSLGQNYQAISKPDGSYLLNSTPFLRLPIAQVNVIYPEGDNVWFGSVNSLIRYDTTMKKNYRRDFPCFIRRVQLINGKSPIFDGCKYKTDNDSQGLFPIIDYKDRNLRFEFAAPFFEDESATRYQCLLEGYDEDWTAWTKETKKDYTNLDSGLYTFRVRAKNVYQNLGEEDVFQFRILPPWYKTWWAFLIYCLTALFLMFLVVKWRSWKLELEKLKLEHIIKQRTKEIDDKNRQLQRKTLQLEEQSEKLKEMDQVKSRFFANISHEFRTPITLIMGPLEQMLSICPGNDPAQKKKLKMMLRNCQRLLRLINQLLELSKFESGTMKLQSRPRNIVHFLKGIIASFEILTDQEELDLIFHAEEEDITLYLDERKMEDVICNLLTNAIKFTPAGGKITVTCTGDPKEKVNFPSGSVKISVSDTGPGIPGDKLADIFHRFYQSESTYEHYHKGFGIGLAIAKELVELHHGTINAHSTEGQGTEFIIELPLGDQHLKPDEIIDLTGESVTPPGTGKIPIPDMVKAEKEEEEPEEEPEQEITAEKAVKDIILVVEDSVDMRGYIKGSLEPRYQVVEAKDGRDGIEKANQIIPDLIISDIMMPETDGYELCRVLKNNRDTSHIPIILLTAKAAEENILQGLEIGADDYVTKPFSTQLLCARIKNLIQLRSHLQLNMSREMTLRPTNMPVSPVDKGFIKEILEVIEKNLSDPDFNVEQLCKKLYMSGATLYRKIRALSGESPTEFIRSYRLKRAAQLLKSGFDSVTEVAFEVGFSSRAYFTKCFREKFHQLPSSFLASEINR